MTTAQIKFVGKDCLLTVSGHSGYGDAGSDIICASVSSMLMLTLNTVTERFGCKAVLSADETGATVTAEVYMCTEAAVGLIKQFARELWEISLEYPENVTVKADFLKGEI